jgi:hypothetical protein
MALALQFSPPMSCFNIFLPSMRTWSERKAKTMKAQSIAKEGKTTNGAHSVRNKLTITSEFEVIVTIIVVAERKQRQTKSFK